MFAFGLILLIGGASGTFVLPGDVKGDTLPPFQEQHNEFTSNLTFQSPLPTPLASPTPNSWGQDCAEIKSILPADHVVALSSDCHISDFLAEVPENTDEVLPPYNPKSHLNQAQGFVPDRIIGTDDRVKIYDTSVFPWSAMVKIEGWFDDSTHFSCSGWMLGPSSVATAAHCIYDYRATKRYAYNVVVTPALNSDASISKPFGSCHAFRSWILSPWFDNGDRGYDYGVYDLGYQIGYKTGNLGLLVIPGSGVVTYDAVTGYPADKGGTTLWSSGGTIQGFDERLFYYDNDTMPGQSGGPVWVTNQRCNPCAIAVNAQEYPPPILNSGPRITIEAFAFFVARRNFVTQMVYLPMCFSEPGAPQSY